jgi:YD repeat-containing protein
VTSPSGRWIAFTYDTSNRVTQAADNVGRTVTYTYDSNGNLSTVTDPASHVTTYTYDTSHRMLTIQDGRSITYLTNTYTNGLVTKQTLRLVVTLPAKIGETLYPSAISVQSGEMNH